MKRFNPEKELKKSKRKYTKKHLVFSLLGLIGLTILGISFAYYSVDDSSVVVNGDVNAPINLALMIDGVEVDNFPAKGSGYGFERVTCVNGTTGIWNASAWTLSLDFTSNDDCIVYFADMNPDDLEAPVLDSKMVAVNILDDGTVIVADKNSEYYAYNFSQWANAVIVNDNSYLTASTGTVVPMTAIEQMYVWIPRYEIKKSSIVNASESIEINFVPISTVNTDIENNDVIVHPAFTFGGVEQAGIWVGKFEMGFNDGESESTANVEYIIKPNVNSVHSTNVSTMYDKINNAMTTYSMDATTDMHMMKNTEWGAVAYLSQSQYGICEDDITCSVKIENNNYYSSSNGNDIVTGCGGVDTRQDVSVSGIEICPASNRWETESGVKASTTHNITGIYDMAGGRWEYVMGNMQDSSGNFFSSSAGFTTAPDAKYYDSYANGLSATDYTRGIYGEATVELNPSGITMSNWNGDRAYFVYSSASWFARGGPSYSGSSAGVWYFSSSNGNANSYASARSVGVVVE